MCTFPIQKVIFVMIVSVFLSLSAGISGCSHEEKTDQAATDSHEIKYKNDGPVKRAQKLSPEAFQNTFFSNAVNRIVSDYPIKQVRDLMQEIVSKIKAKELFFVFDYDGPLAKAVPHAWATSMKFQGSPMNGKPAMIIFSKKWIDRHAEFSDSMFDDQIVVILLHEYFHMTHGDYLMTYEKLLAGKEKRTDKNEIIKDECDAWAHSASLMNAMMQSGRFSNWPSDFAGDSMRLYQRLNGNTADPQWRQHVMSIM